MFHPLTAEHNFVYFFLWQITLNKILNSMTVEIRYKSYVSVFSKCNRQVITVWNNIG